MIFAIFLPTNQTLHVQQISPTCSYRNPIKFSKHDVEVFIKEIVYSIGKIDYLKMSRMHSSRINIDWLISQITRNVIYFYKKMELNFLHILLIIKNIM